MFKIFEENDKQELDMPIFVNNNKFTYYINSEL